MNKARRRAWFFDFLLRQVSRGTVQGSKQERDMMICQEDAVWFLCAA